MDDKNNITQNPDNPADPNNSVDQNNLTDPNNSVKADDGQKEGTDGQNVFEGSFDDKRLNQVNDLFNENDFKNVVAVPENPGGENEQNDQYDDVSPVTPATPVVAVGIKEEKMPKWFYFVFAVTFVIFITVTVLLGLTFVKNGFDLSFISGVTKKATPTPVQKPTGIPTPTLVKPTIDPVLLEIKNINASDSLDKINEDLTKTNLNFIDESINILDKESGYLPKLSY